MSFFSRHISTVSKTFPAEISNPPYLGRRTIPMAVSVRHNVITGSRQVLIDGQTVEGTKGFSGIISSNSEGNLGLGSTIKFSFHHAESKKDINVEIRIKPSFLSYDYECLVDGVFIDEEEWAMNQALRQGRDADGVTLNTVTIKVDTYRVDVVKGEKKAYFKLVSTLTNPNGAEPEVVEVWKSFSEQLDVANIAKSSYKSSHLKSSFPSFPTRFVGMSVDQFSSEFLNSRKIELEDFWRKLGGFPRIAGRFEVLRFLGFEGERGAGM
ncbi:hypothetical protein TrLO_g8563 [Triparma laevis f. longispina]|uniref:PX domain-containing protein n=1 Tax=Triparma laevis f. longispina TaxID=1714387 RepID=A0A9W7KVW9_9STRA|nr:hypothetical protein TrLO_g8563 [Triparma laevis f. longispina]